MFVPQPPKPTFILQQQKQKSELPRPFSAFQSQPFKSSEPPKISAFAPQPPQAFGQDGRQSPMPFTVLPLSNSPSPFTVGPQRSEPPPPKKPFVLPSAAPSMSFMPFVPPSVAPSKPFTFSPSSIPVKLINFVPQSSASSNAIAQLIKVPPPPFTTAPPRAEIPKSFVPSQQPKVSFSIGKPASAPSNPLAIFEKQQWSQSQTPAENLMEKLEKAAQREDKTNLNRIREAEALLEEQRLQVERRELETKLEAIRENLQRAWSVIEISSY